MPVKKFPLSLPGRAQTGAGLIEVLVSIVIMSFGMLGMAGLYNYSIAANKNASSRLTAAMLATDYAEVVHANRTEFLAGSYNNALGNYDPAASVVNAIAAASFCTFPNCTSAAIATQDNALMAARVRAYLPAGAYASQRVGTTNQLDIWIVWVEGKGGAAPETAIDNCPPELAGRTIDPFPRCLHNRVTF
jgi:type IV pilus assembly protein PilV